MRKLFILLLFFSYLNVNAQGLKDYKYILKPLDSALLKATDTVLILEIIGYYTHNLPIAYLTKKGDTTNIFKYGSGYAVGTRIPTGLRSFFGGERYTNFTLAKPNRKLDMYFNIIGIPNRESLETWNEIMSKKLFEMKDDNDLGEGCDIFNNDKNYYDEKLERYSLHRRGVILTILTSKINKSLVYNSPEIFEEVCPGRKGRQNILAIRKIIEKYIDFRD